MKLKIFENQSTVKLQESINEWLSNKKLMIIDSKMSIGMQVRGYSVVRTNVITIFYEESE